MISCRAWELIDGRLDFVIRDLGAEIETSIMDTMNLKHNDGLALPLSPDDLILIVGISDLP